MCDQEPELHDELKSLIEAASEAGEFMESVVDVELDALAQTDPAPSHCGVYEILERIGQGGSGTVFSAARADDLYQKKVAIKILRSSRADQDLLRRFFNERQVLASLDHPNIAELFDGGSTEDGLPYLVMEYVDGLPIHKYCDQQQLSLTARLELFCKVCDAVAHAHQKLVVHRDIKPANILVTHHGEPKLLDFGIAKLLNPQMVSWELAATTDWYRPLTPHYASPEQIRGDLITTRSDIYSLGILLYQLLTGRLPYRLKGSALQDAERAISSVKPSLPSVAVTGPEADLPRMGSTRLNRQQLARKLAGDLDIIVLTALRKEPERRYGSAEQLAEDIRRHLTARPVLARKDTWRYRLVKFVGRNRVLAGLITAFLVVVTVLISFLSLQSVRLAHEAEEARKERDRSTQVLGLMTEVLGSADPFDSDGHEPTASEILERTVDRLGQLEDQPEAQVILLGLLGGIYLERGDHSKAESLLRRAAHLHRNVLPEAGVAATETLGTLGIVLRRQGRLVEAEQIQRETLELRRKVFGEGSQEIAWSYNDLAVVLKDQGRRNEAAALLRQALAQYRKVLGNDNAHVATTLNNLGTLLGQIGQVDEAEQCHREALEIRIQVLGPEHLYTASSRVNLAHTLLLKDDWPQAEPHLIQGVEQLTKILPEGHPERLRAWVVLARLDKSKGNYPAAELQLRDVLPAMRALYGDHARVAGMLAELAELRRLQGDLGDAERLAHEAYTMRRDVLGSQHPDTLAIQLFWTALQH